MVITLKQVPSHLTIAGYRVLISYEGQPMTCYRSNKTGHLIHACALRQRTRETVERGSISAWAGIVARETVENHCDLIGGGGGLEAGWII